MGYCRRTPDAAAKVTGSADAPPLRGCVEFHQRKNCVLVVAKICGLPAKNDTGFYGFHIHQGNSCSGTDFSGTAGHYNPTGQLHPQHAGDLPPLLNCQGTAYLAVTTDRFSVKDIIGRTVVIHSAPDDLHTQPAGNAGSKIACGVIHKCL